MEEWSISEAKNIKEPRQINVHLPKVLFAVAIVVLLAWSVVSTIFVIRASYFVGDASLAVSSTSLMCAERLMNEVDAKAERKATIDTLTRENLFLRGRISSLEELYGLSKTNYEAAKGVGGD